jgi:hypothetical protein
MRIIEKKVYYIHEHPNQELCLEWIRNNWHDLNDHELQDLIDSLKALSKEIGGSLDYSISVVPDRGEYIRFKDYDHEHLCRLSSEDLPLTGCYWDSVVIQNLRKGDTKAILKVLHESTEYAYSNEGIIEFCEGNEYEFDEDGKFI